MNRKGFTLIELVIVIVLIGIIAAFVAPKLGDVTSTKAGSFADKLRSDIRYAQNLAMSQNLRYRVYFNTAPSPNPGYAVVNDANGNGTWGEVGEVALDPAGSGNLSITLNAGQYAGITFSAVGFSGNYIEFNSLGIPFDNAGALTVNKNVTISPGGTIVTVTAQTGAVN
jgi:prepilin-type N-terminal cleavage/methylation domain-containing protein